MPMIEYVSVLSSGTTITKEKYLVNYLGTALPRVLSRYYNKHALSALELEPIVGLVKRRRQVNHS